LTHTIGYAGLINCVQCVFVIVSMIDARYSTYVKPRTTHVTTDIITATPVSVPPVPLVKEQTEYTHLPVGQFPSFYMTVFEFVWRYTCYIRKTV